MEKKKSLNTKSLIVISVITILIIAAIFIVFSVIKNGKSINIKDYIVDNITYSGYDGYGTIDTNKHGIIDMEKLVTDMGIDTTNIGNAFGIEVAFEKYINIEYAVGEDPSNLKNGDIVEYKISVNYDAINNMNAEKKLKGDDIIIQKYTVSGLEKVVEIDPFSVIKKVVIDTEDQNRVYIVYNDDNKIGDYTMGKKFSFGYSINMNENENANVNFKQIEIANINSGDKVTLELDDEYAYNYAQQYGFVFSKTSQEYQVLTCKKMTNKNEINDSSIEMIKTEFQNYVNQEDDGNYKFYGLYFYFNEGEYTHMQDNYIIALYKYKSNAIGSKTQYLPIATNNILVDTDGDIIIDALHGFSKYSELDSIKEFEDQYSSSENGVNVLAFDKL